MKPADRVKVIGDVFHNLLRSLANPGESAFGDNREVGEGYRYIPFRSDWFLELLDKAVDAFKAPKRTTTWHVPGDIVRRIAPSEHKTRKAAEVACGKMGYGSGHIRKISDRPYVSFIDAGCGPGITLKLARGGDFKHQLTIEGVEIQESMVKFAKCWTGCTIHQGDITKFDFSK